MKQVIRGEKNCQNESIRTQSENNNPLKGKERKRKIIHQPTSLGIYRHTHDKQNKFLRIREAHQPMVVQWI